MSKMEQERPESNKRTIRYESEEHNFRATTEEIDGKPVRKIRGYALLFDTFGSPWLGSPWKEKIDKTALSETKLAGAYGLINHDSTWVIAKAGKNMTMTVDKIGLFIEIILGSTWVDDYIYDRVERELIDGMSFWFDSKTVVVTDWENKTDTIVKINEIYEVSILPFPAYPQTVVVAEEQRSADLDGTEEEKKALDEEARALALLDLELEG